MTAITLELRPLIYLTEEQFYQLCQNNPDIRLERNAKGELIIMPPTGWGTGKRNFSLLGQLWVWVENNSGLGVGFDSSTGFKLPNGADRSFDAAWVRQERLDALNPDPDKFLPLSPDFVVECSSQPARAFVVCDRPMPLGVEV